MTEAHGSKAKEDIGAVLKLIKSFWPDYQITSQHLLRPTSEFVYDFYTRYLDKIDNALAEMIEENNLMGNLMDNNKDHDPFVYLYVHISNVLKMINVNYFKISDICQPTVRTKTTIKMAMNLLVYIQNFKEEARHIINGVRSVSDKKNELNEQVELLKEELSKLASDIGATTEVDDQLSSELEEQLKIDYDINILRKQDELEKQRITDELEALKKTLEEREMLLEDLNKEERLLQTQIVTDEEHENLKVTLNNLKEKLKEQSDYGIDYQETIENKKNHIDQFKKMINILEYSDSCFEKAHLVEERKQEIAKLMALKYSDEIKQQKLILSNTTKNIKTIKETMNSQVCKFNNITRDVTGNITRVKQECTKEKECFEEKFKKLKDSELVVQSQILQLESDIKQIGDMNKDYYENLIATANNNTTLSNEIFESLKDLVFTKDSTLS